MKRIPLALALLLASAVRADEGMWTYDNFPSQKVAKKYGFAPSKEWLDEARLASVRLAGGCSGSFVSPDGLVMTNHHCAHSCIEQLSTKDRDFVAQGFYAPTLEAEVKCPEIELNQLIGITDVTPRIHGATEGLKPGKEFNDKRKAAMAAVETECAAGNDKLRCDVVELYHGGVYSLYKYKRFQDVRLVFAPEFRIAFFGGDPDNFNFPRYDLDVSFIRAWEDGKPAHTEHSFKWSTTGPKEGDLSFVSGHPGGTDRELTMSELAYERNVALPERIAELAQYRGALTMFNESSPEHARIGEAQLFFVENSYKALTGRFEAIVTDTLWNQKVEREKKLRAKVNARPALKKKYGQAWDDVTKAVAMFEPKHREYRYIEDGAGFGSPLYRAARDLVRGTAELQKPDAQRLREYTDSKLPQLKQRLFSKAPIYPEFEVFKLTYGLTKLREVLGADNPFVKKVLGKQSPAELAQALTKSKLYDPAVRQQLWQAGHDAVMASDDPMIKLAKLVDPDARVLRKWHDEEYEPLRQHGDELVAAAKFDLEGKSNYPDATFTLRLSYGAVKGYQDQGHQVAPLTNFAGAFDRATGRDPFKLPDSWLAAQDKKQISMSTPFDFCSTNDIIGGNSGSPVFDKDLKVVGLIFDGNIQSLGGEYGFDESVNRSVAVDSAALTEALDHIYGAKRIVQELKGSGGIGSGAGSK
jgi:stalled ribosome alternative rescue factor ArfA